MRTLVITGALGMLGAELVARGRTQGWNTVGLEHTDLDIRDSGAVSLRFSYLQPAVVINAAGYTAVDQAELEPDLAFAVNAAGAENVARAAARCGAAVIHISSDYVFDGSATWPYVPTDPTGPIGVYGRSKLEGEIRVAAENNRHVIVRTSWLFWHHGKNFVRSIAEKAALASEIRVVHDQHGRPTSAGDLAEALIVVANRLIAADPPFGIYHFANAGQATWYNFACEIVTQLGRGSAVVPILTAEFPTRARRPAYSVLDTSSFTNTFGVDPRAWRESLREVLERLS